MRTLADISEHVLAETIRRRDMRFMEASMVDGENYAVDRGDGCGAAVIARAVTRANGTRSTCGNPAEFIVGIASTGSLIFRLLARPFGGALTARIYKTRAMEIARQWRPALCRLNGIAGSIGRYRDEIEIQTIMTGWIRLRGKISIARVLTWSESSTSDLRNPLRPRSARLSGRVVPLNRS